MPTWNPKSQQLACFLFLMMTGLTPAFPDGPDENAARELHRIFEAEWDVWMENSPEWASSLGDRRFNTKWSDVSLAAHQRRHDHGKEILKQLKRINVDKLSASDRVNIELFRKRYELNVEAFQYGWYLVPLTQRGGIQNQNSTVDALRFEKEQDFLDWIVRLRALPEKIKQTQALMQEGIRRRIIQPKVVMTRVPKQIRKQIVDDPAKSPFYKPFRDMPESIEESRVNELQTEAQTVIRDDIVPAYKSFLKFFETKYLPACFDEVGVSQIPRGQEFYAYRARMFTTTEMTPREIHEIGLAEVKRIRAEMEQIVKDVKFKGSFAEFLNFLRTDRQFYFDNPDDLFQAYQDVGKRIDPKMPELFGKLPRVGYRVKAIPALLAPDTTTAYYMRPSADGTRPGTYYVNLYKPEARPRYEIEALSLHEAVPGHHLQIALAMELENMPRFRRFSGYTAYVEGWALYAESLGEEIGLYQDPYSKFGQLTYEMWRAIRLVVDTGMHSMGWTREQAIALFKENTAKTRLDIENEVDRYISWPGQALAYKIGELKILALRAKAEQTLGKNFDIKAFHDFILSNGAVPLATLESLFEDWLRRQAAN